MNRCDNRAGPFFATDSEDGARSNAYERLTRDLLRAKEQVRAQQHL